MSTNEEIFVRRFVEMFNMLDMSIADEIFAPDFKAHLPTLPAVVGLSGFKGFMMGLYDTFPNLMLEIEDTIPALDRLVLRGAFTGRQDGDLFTIQPTGREIMLPVTFIFHLDNGGIVENWTQMDFFGAIVQISNGEPLNSGDCP